MSLRNLLGYDTQYITVWTLAGDDKKDKYGRPIEAWEKTTLKGRLYHNLKVSRTLTGDTFTSLGQYCIPEYYDIRKVVKFELGECENMEEPSNEARQALSVEEIYSVGQGATEWIYLV